MPPVNNGNHVVVKNGVFHAIVAGLSDGNYVVIRPGDAVYTTQNEAIAAAESDGREKYADVGSLIEVTSGKSETNGDWLHE